MHFLYNLQLSLLFVNCCIGPLRETVNRLKGKKKKVSLAKGMLMPPAM